MNPLRRPVVAGLGPGAGTSVLAAALHGIDAGRWTGGPVDVLVCPAGTDAAALPEVPVVALRGGRGPAARHAGAAVVLPEVAAWHGADATRAAAGLLGLAPHRRPPTQRGYADALLALTAALLRSGALTAPPRAPAARPRSAAPPRSVAPQLSAAPPVSTAAAPRTPRTTRPGGRHPVPGCAGPARRPAPAPDAVPGAATSTGSIAAVRGGPAPGVAEPGAPARTPGRVVVADPRHRAPAPPPRPASAPSAAACAALSVGAVERPDPSAALREAAVHPDATAHPGEPAAPDATRSAGPAAPDRTPSTTGTAPARTIARATAAPAGAGSPDDDALDHDALHGGTAPVATHAGVPAGTAVAGFPAPPAVDPAVSGPRLLGPAPESGARPSREIDVRGPRRRSDPTHVDLVARTDRLAGSTALDRPRSSGGVPAVASAVPPGTEPAIGSAPPPAAEPAAGSPKAESAATSADSAVSSGVEPVVTLAGPAGHLDPAVRPTAAAPVLLHRAEPVRPRLVAGRALRLAGPDTAPSSGADPCAAAAVPMPPLVRPEAARRAAAGRRLRIAPVVAVAVGSGAGGPDDDAIEHSGAVPAQAGASALRTG